MKKVKIYTAPSCQVCQELKRELRRRGVDFEELDITTNDEATRTLAERKIKAVPVLEIDGQFTVGYNEKWLRERFKC